MNASFWLGKLEQADPSYLLLATFAGASLLAGILYRISLIGWLLHCVGLVLKGAIRQGFLVWQRLLGWASWPQFLAFVMAFLLAGGVAGGQWYGLRIVFGLPPVFMGMIACLSYMFIELERNEVERGHKVVHNPLKGQVVALNLERFGRQLRMPLLGCATVALIGGFALLNQGLYATIGRGWYQVANARKEPVYVDFLAYTLAQTLGIVDVMDLFKSHHILGAASVRVATWPARASCWAGSSCFSRWSCSIRSSHLCGRECCWPRRSPISGAPTIRSTSGLAMRYPPLAIWRSVRCSWKASVRMPPGGKSPCSKARAALSAEHNGRGVPPGRFPVGRQGALMRRRRSKVHDVDILAYHLHNKVIKYQMPDGKNLLIGRGH